MGTSLNTGKIRCCGFGDARWNKSNDLTHIDKKNYYTIRIISYLNGNVESK